MNSRLTDNTFFLDLTLQDIMPYPEDILYSGYRYNAFTVSLSKEEIQEVRKKNRLVEIDSIPSYIGYGIMEEFVDGRIIQLKEWKINHGEHVMNIGEYAPDFTLQDKDGKTVSLSDFKGRKVVLYFYPKDNTPGCTRQAIGFAENYNEFKKRNITVIGISKDSVESHVKFAEKNNLPFILLSDPELKAIQDYGVWQEKKLYGKVSMGVVRTTFIINEEGSIQDIMRKVKPDTNAEDVLAKIK